MDTTQLRQQIQKLIIILQSKDKNIHQRINSLFRKLEEIKEIELLGRLEGKYLEAYLLWKSIRYANYQLEHLKNLEFDNEKYLETIGKEVDILETEMKEEGLIKEETEKGE